MIAVVNLSSPLLLLLFSPSPFFANFCIRGRERGNGADDADAFIHVRTAAGATQEREITR